jgi:hypothetical protein
MPIALEARASLRSAGLRPERRRTWTGALPSTTGPRAQPALRSEGLTRPPFPRAPLPQASTAVRRMRNARMAAPTAAVSITSLDPPCARSTSASPTQTVPRGRRASAVARLRTTARTLAYPVATASLTRTAVPGAIAPLHPRRWNAQDRAPIIATPRRTRAPTMRTVQRSTRGQAW